MEIDPNVLQESVDFIAEAQPLLQKAAETEAAVAAAVPELVDNLIKRGFVEASVRDTAIKNMQDPLRLISAMNKLAEIQTREKAAAAPAPATLGAAEVSNSKTAGSGQSKMKESDKVFLSRFGFSN